MKNIGFLALGMVLIVLAAWVFGWFGKGLEKTSANHVEAQWTTAYSNYSSLKAIAANACSAKKLADGEVDPAIKAQRQSQFAAQEQNYNRVAGQYESAMANAFEAKLIKPADLPRTAPTISEAMVGAGC